MIIQGARYVSHILQLAHDSGLRKLWEWIRFSVETTVVRSLNLFCQSQVIKIGNLNQVLRQKIWNRRWRCKITLDLDSTIKTVHGHQQVAEKDYNPAHPDKRNYYPLTGFIAETGEALMGWLRPVAKEENEIRRKTLNLLLIKGFLNSAGSKSILPVIYFVSGFKLILSPSGIRARTYDTPPRSRARATTCEPTKVVWPT